MNRVQAEPIILREFDLTIRDFRKAPSAACWNRVEDCMYALQWIRTRNDLEVSLIIEHLPETLPPDLLVRTLAEVMRGHALIADAERIAGSLNRPRKDLRKAKAPPHPPSGKRPHSKGT